MSTNVTNALSDLAEINPGVNTLGLSGESWVSFIPMSDVSDTGQWIVRQQRRLSEVRVGYTPFAEGDVLFAKITPCMENGKGAHTTGLINGIGFGSTEFHVLRARGDNDPRFLFHWLQARPTRTKAIAFMGGSAGQQRVQAEFFTHFRIPHIEPNEQSRIAAVLDTVDETIAATEAIITKLKQVRAGLLHDLLTRGLDEHGQLRDPIAHPGQFTDSPVGRIPKEWMCSRFDRVLDGIDAGKSPDYSDQPAAPGDWGVLKVSAIWPEGFRPRENKRVTKAMHQVAAYEIRNGDLLISRSNTYELVGLVCLVRNAPPRLMLCDKTLRLRLKAELGINPFFELLLQTRTARNQIEINATGTSGSMKNISQEVIRALCLAYPKVEEQQRILAAVSPIDYELDALRREFHKLIQLKSGLMADLITGHVRVPESISVVENQA
jgi:type I restriction enzyme, S subunit